MVLGSSSEEFCSHVLRMGDESTLPFLFDLFAERSIPMGRYESAWSLCINSETLLLPLFTLSAVTSGQEPTIQRSGLKAKGSLKVAEIR